MKFSLDGSLSIAPSLLCVGLFTVWWILLPYNQGVFGDGGNEIIISNAFRGLFPIVGAFAATKWGRLVEPLNVAMTIIMSFFGFLYFANPFHSDGNEITLFLAIASMASGWLFVSWSKPYVERDLNTSSIHYCIAMASASIVAFIFPILPRIVSEVAVGAIPFIIFFAYRASLTTSSGYNSESIEPEKVLTRGFIIRWSSAVLLYGVVWGIMQSLPFGAYDYSSFEIAAYRILSIVTTAALPLTVIVFKKKLPLDGLLITIVAVSAICILATIISGFTLNTEISVVYASINYLIHPFFWIFLTYLSQKLKANYYYVFAAGWSMLLIANVFGHLLTKGLSVVEDSGYIIGSVTLFILFVSVLCLIVPRSTERSSPEALNFIISPPSLLMNVNAYRAEAIEQVIREYGLTGKEAKIVAMLAQGRTFQYCADTMKLSVNTIGAYVKTIYAKLDVHAKEELLDVIDAHVEIIIEKDRR